jgi:peptidoglycan/xylan/chitin deacetylase (PgdA/CDA1 family)
MMLPPLSLKQRDDILERLRTWAGQDRCARPSHRTLTEPETVALAAGDLIEIGAHTAAHPVLSMLPVAEQKREIEASKQRLEAVLGRAVVSFAYPYGSLSDYGRETIKTVQAAGFESACTTFDDVVRPACWCATGMASGSIGSSARGCSSDRRRAGAEAALGEMDAASIVRYH